MSDQRKAFEEWFRKLDSDFYDIELDWSEQRGRYFYTTTHALWTQYQTIAKLLEIKEAAKAVVDSGILYKYLELHLKAALEGVE